MYILSVGLLLIIFMTLRKTPRTTSFSYDLSSSMQMKGVAIILIIIGHLNIEFFDWRFMSAFGTIGVSMFLFSSGYGLVKSYQKNGLKGFTKKRIVTVLFPYMIVTSFWLIVDFALGIRHGFITSLLSLLGLDFSRSVDGTMWYIPFILFWYLAFFIVFKFINNNPIRVLTLFSVSIIPMIIWITEFAGGASYQWGIHSFMFPVGVFYAIYLENWVIKYNFKILIPSFILTGSLCFLGYLTQRSDGLYFMFADTMALFFILSILIIIRWYGIKSGILTLVGEYSYELYLVEGYLIDKIIKSEVIPKTQSIIVFLVTLILLSLVVKKITKDKKIIKRLPASL